MNGCLWEGALRDCTNRFVGTVWLRQKSLVGWWFLLREWASEVVTKLRGDWSWANALLLRFLCPNPLACSPLSRPPSCSVGQKKTPTTQAKGRILFVTIVIKLLVYIWIKRKFYAFLSSGDSDLIWNHVPWLMEKNQEIAVKVKPRIIKLPLQQKCICRR